MTPLKRHLATSEVTTACGRGKVTTTNVYAVSCRNCENTPAYRTRKEAADKAKAEAFMAQPPREYREPWRAGNIVCKSCGGDQFREGDRTCYGHYENYYCANCGHVESRLTETGMSF